LWEYFVTNTGNVRLTEVQVSDDQGVAVSCPQTALDPGQAMTCTGHGTAQLGQYRNVGTVTGRDSQGNQVTDSDPSHYLGVASAIDIEKHTNGQDADTPTGPQILVGAPVLWEYFVTNTGNVRLTDIQVTDDQGVAVSCPQTALDPGQAMTCTGHGTARLGQYRNVGTATGRDSQGNQVTDSDPSHYLGVTCFCQHAIDIQKYTNGMDADVPTGPQIPVGAPVLWEYFVTNTSQAALTDIQVSDDQGVAVSCPRTALDPDEQMTCTGHGTAQAGQYRNVGTVTARDPQGNQVTDSDPSHYYGIQPPVP